ncbi:MAG: hypothetical protein ACRCU2_09130, partial [Planktothrix sp.]
MRQAKPTLKEYIEDILKDLINVRRSIHAYPEVGWLEYETTLKIIKSLQTNNIHLKMGREIHTPHLRFNVPSQTDMESHFCEVVNKFPEDSQLLETIKDGFTGVVAIIEGKRPGVVRAIRCDIDALPILEAKEKNHFPVS